MKNGIELLRRETPDETITRLENELIKERKGRSNDIIFSESEYKQLSEFTLEICDDGLCDGDQSVGILQCKYWVDSEVSGCGYGYCKLKRFCGKD